MAGFVGVPGQPGPHFAPQGHDAILTHLLNVLTLGGYMHPNESKMYGIDVAKALNPTTKKGLINLAGIFLTPRDGIQGLEAEPGAGLRAPTQAPPTMQDVLHYLTRPGVNPAEDPVRFVERQAEDVGKPDTSGVPVRRSALGLTPQQVAVLQALAARRA